MIYGTRKLTKSVLEKLPTPAETTIIWDEGYPYKGHKFGVRLSPSGKRAFFVRYNIRVDGAKKQAAPNLIDVDEFIRDASLTMQAIYDLALDTVRAGQKAGALPSEIARAEREEAERAAREAERAAREAEQAEQATERTPDDITIAEAGEAFHTAKEKSPQPLAPTVVRQRKTYLAKAAAFFVYPDGTPKPLATLTKADGRAFLDHIIASAKADSEKRREATAEGKKGGKKRRKGLAGKGGRVGSVNPGAAAAKLAATAVNDALKHAAEEMKCPCNTDILRGYKHAKSNAKTGAMTPEERKAFFDALAGWEAKHHNDPGRAMIADLIRLAYLVGGRGIEWKQARWSQVRDLFGPDARWTFQNSERKQRTAHEQYLDADAVAVLRRLHQRHAARWGAVRPRDYIFPGAHVSAPHEGHRSDYSDAFDVAVEASGINEGKTGSDILTPHRIIRASRITEMIEEMGWSAKEVAEDVGLDEATVLKHYAVPLGKKARAKARRAAMPSMFPMAAE